MTAPLVMTEVKDRIATVTLNDPERRNPIIGPDMIDEMLAAFASIEVNPDVRVMILTGTSPAFCAGGDVKGEGWPGRPLPPSADIHGQVGQAA